jgi:GNAT superfamily N-acetyltransferase
VLEPAFTFQPLRIEDAGLANSLAKTVGFKTDPDVWRWMLSLGPGIAAHDRELGLVGTVLLLPYGSDVAMMAMMIVHAERQQRGIGRELLSRALARGRFVTHALYATTVGEKLYRPLGFVDQGANLRLEGEIAIEAATDVPGLRAMTDADLPRVVSLDARAHGAPRATLLRSIRARATGALVIDRGDLELAGYGFAMRDQTTRRVGPLVAARDEDAIALASALGRDADTVRIDCEPGETALCEWARASGLSAGEVVPRLYRGRALAGERHMIRALAGRAFG